MSPVSPALGKESRTSVPIPDVVPLDVVDLGLGTVPLCDISERADGDF